MVKVDSWGLPVNTQGIPKVEVANQLDINVDNDDIETKLDLVNSNLESIGLNNWSNNNNILINNITLNNNSKSSETLDIGTLGGVSLTANPIKKIFLTGKMNLTNPTDNINLFFSNGVNYYMGEGIRPQLNTIDSMYHFTYTMGGNGNDGFDRYLKIGNVCGTAITNLTINYTFLK